jgi:hypothetical protein
MPRKRGGAAQGQDGAGAHRIIALFARAPMEADRVNLIQTSLQDLAARTAELRRYL